MHSWSRTEAGIVYVVVGDGGNREGHASGLVESFKLQLTFVTVDCLVA
jgi:hypothetical protein